MLCLLNVSRLGHNAICWFQSYLTDRSQCVRLGSTVSDPVTLEKGVPQGSILGPLLFLLYVNNICNQMQFSTYHMYSDDTIVYSCAPSLGMAVSNLKSDCITLQHALLDSKLLLNSKKTKAMLFASKQCFRRTRAERASTPRAGGGGWCVTSRYVVSGDLNFELSRPL